MDQIDILTNQLPEIPEDVKKRLPPFWLVSLLIISVLGLAVIITSIYAWKNQTQTFNCPECNSCCPDCDPPNSCCPDVTIGCRSSGCLAQYSNFPITDSMTVQKFLIFSQSFFEISNGDKFGGLINADSVKNRDMKILSGSGDDVIVNFSFLVLIPYSPSTLIFSELLFVDPVFISFDDYNPQYGDFKNPNGYYGYLSQASQPSNFLYYATASPTRNTNILTDTGSLKWGIQRPSKTAGLYEYQKLLVTYEGGQIWPLVDLTPEQNSRNTNYNNTPSTGIWGDYVLCQPFKNELSLYPVSLTSNSRSITSIFYGTTIFKVFAV